MISCGHSSVCSAFFRLFCLGVLLVMSSYLVQLHSLYFRIHSNSNFNRRCRSARYRSIQFGMHQSFVTLAGLDIQIPLPSRYCLFIACMI